LAVLDGPGDGDQVGHLDRGEPAKTTDLAGDLDGDHVLGPAFTDGEEVDPVDGYAVGVSLLLLRLEVDAGFGRSAETKLTTLVSTGKRIGSSFQNGKEGPSLLTYGQQGTRYRTNTSSTTQEPDDIS